MTAPVLQELYDEVVGSTSGGVDKVVAVGDYFVSVGNSTFGGRLYISVYEVNEDNEVVSLSSTRIHEDDTVNSFSISYDSVTDTLLLTYAYDEPGDEKISCNVCLLDNDGALTIKTEQVLNVNLDDIHNMDVLYDPTEAAFIFAFSRYFSGNTTLLLQKLTVTDRAVGTVSGSSLNTINTTSGFINPYTIKLVLRESTGDIVVAYDLGSTHDLEFATCYFSSGKYEINTPAGFSDTNVTIGDYLTLHAIAYDNTSTGIVVVFTNTTTATANLAAVMYPAGASVGLGTSLVLNIPIDMLNCDITPLPPNGIVFISYVGSVDYIFSTFLTVNVYAISVDTNIISKPQSSISTVFVNALWHDRLERLLTMNIVASDYTRYILSKLYPFPFWRDNQGQSEKVDGSPIEV